MRARYHVAIRRPNHDAILVDAVGAMPGFTLEDAPWWQIVTPVVEALAADPGIDVVVLRAAWLGEVDAEGRVDRLYEAVWTGGATPSGHRWVEPSGLPLRPTPLGRAIEAGALEPAAGDRQPWYLPGWYARMAAWVEDALATAGLHRRGPIRQVRSWGRSALLRVETDRGSLWAKQVPDVFAHEVSLTQFLADVDPGIVPPVVAAARGAGRLLLEHVDGPLLPEYRDGFAAWTATLARLAEIQRVLHDDLDAVRVAGVPTMTLESLADAVPSLLADPDLALLGRPGGLSVEEHGRLAEAADLLADATRALATLPPGPSVDHGDFAASQVIVGEMGPVILDWSDATITHPTIAAASFLMDPADLPADPAEADDRLAQAYLAGWGAAGDRRALELARCVHPLHMARLYGERILPGLEQRWEMERMVPWFLASLLPRLDDLPRILRG